VLDERPNIDLLRQIPLNMPIMENRTQRNSAKA
jgi:hypothetical protein